MIGSTNGFPLYKDIENERTLKLCDNGKWTIINMCFRSAYLHFDFLKADDVWVFTNENLFQGISLSVVPFSFPESYFIKYKGDDPNVQNIFTDEGLGGGIY